MFAESENVTSPIRLSDGSVSFPSTYRALISSSRNLTVSSTLFSPMLPDVSTAITMSEPHEQAVTTSIMQRCTEYAKNHPLKNLFQQKWHEFEPNVQNLYASIHTTYLANFIMV